MPGHRPFSELRARMSPEHLARNEQRVQETLTDIAMNHDTPSAKPKRTVTAPITATFSGSSPVLSVELEMDEDVEWQWTHLPNGESIVTGYKIIKKEKPETGFDFKEAVSG